MAWLHDSVGYIWNPGRDTGLWLVIFALRLIKKKTLQYMYSGTIYKNDII